MLIHNQATMVQVEAEASLLIATEDQDEVERDVGDCLSKQEDVMPKGD